VMMNTNLRLRKRGNSRSLFRGIYKHSFQGRRPRTETFGVGGTFGRGGHSDAIISEPNNQRPSVDEPR